MSHKNNLGLFSSEMLTVSFGKVILESKLIHWRRKSIIWYVTLCSGTFFRSVETVGNIYKKSWYLGFRISLSAFWWIWLIGLPLNWSKLFSGWDFMAVFQLLDVVCFWPLVVFFTPEYTSILKKICWLRLFGVSDTTGESSRLSHPSISLSLFQTVSVVLKHTQMNLITS